MRILNVLILCFLTVLLGIGLTYMWGIGGFSALSDLSGVSGNIVKSGSSGNLSGTSDNSAITGRTIDAGADKNYGNGEMQFYPNMRYADRRISYWIESACDAEKQVDILLSLSMIANRTVLQFYPKQDGAEIKFLCSDVAPTAEEKGHFIAGEGGPSDIINSSNYAVILTGKVSLFRTETCRDPKIAPHEILHALGFDHNSNKDSIMYPVTDCGQSIDSYIIDEINRLYKVDSAPDLLVEKVNANESSGYLNFEIFAANYGLKTCNNSTLLVSSDGKEIKAFDLKEIDIGAKKSLTVQNLQLPNAGNKVAFDVVCNEPSKEISTDNNKIDLNMV